MHELEKLKYPIGKFISPESVSDTEVECWIKEIADLPLQLKEAGNTISTKSLDEVYRPGGWTRRQVIHHVADSHINAYIRFKLAATEENPTIRPYLEERWAECDEARNADIEVSLNLIEALHQRWVLFMHTMTATDWNKTYYHPANKKIVALKEVAGMYAWHGKHHLHHVLSGKSG